MSRRKTFAVVAILLTMGSMAWLASAFHRVPKERIRTVYATKIYAKTSDFPLAFPNGNYRCALSRESKLESALMMAPDTDSVSGSIAILRGGRPLISGSGAHAIEFHIDDSSAATYVIRVTVPPPPNQDVYLIVGRVF